MSLQDRGSPPQGSFRADSPAAPVSKPLVTYALALIPLLLLGFLVAWLATRGLSPLGKSPVPLEELTVERSVFRTDEMLELHVRNTGPEPITLNTLIINKAVWDFSISPQGEIPRLGKAVITVPYHWVEGEPYTFTLISASAVKFEHEVEAATPTPGMNLKSLGALALLGLYVGVIPVYLGLVWYPFLRRLSSRGYHALLSLTAGLLVFLAVDTVKEGLEMALATPGALKAVPVFASGLLGSVLGLIGLGRWLRQRGETRPAWRNRLVLAYMIAAGIGLHNLGEGLGIGAAYAVGEVAVGAQLVIGFTIHNITEGPAIIAPMTQHRISLGHLLVLGAMGGGPTVIGAWVGGYAFWPLLAALFFGIAAGAIIQVLYEVGKLMIAEQPDGVTSLFNLAAFFAGLAIMYLTGLAVAG